MPRKRLRPTCDSSSDSDDAPETFTLAESKKSAKRKSEEIARAHATINRQSKLKNQERDRVLKEQANRRKERENAKGTEDGRVGALEARMERAMKDAQDEESLDGDLEEERGFPGDGIEGEFASNMDADVQADTENGTAEEEEEDLEKKPSKHLPDHLFEAAFASQSAQLEKASKSTTESSSKAKPSKKKKRKSQSKDIVLGSRTVRTLLLTSQIQGEGSHAPMRKAQKFIDRSLALKGGNSRLRGWQRKAANIGVMRQSGPAAKFVRS